MLYFPSDEYMMDLDAPQDFVVAEVAALCLRSLRKHHTGCISRFDGVREASSIA